MASRKRKTGRNKRKPLGESVSLGGLIFAERKKNDCGGGARKWEEWTESRTGVK